ncbi:FtsX-like permease family protein [Nocardia sp. NPDC050710]|uniref:FtsX-like permease family protein n=1 Tax=Nocardia sp. NPDC050710 TaxID=3157220 RepID=UPI0033C79B37
MGIRAGLDRFRVVNITELRKHGARSAVLVGVIAVSAALLVAVLGIYGSMTGSVQRLASGIAGNADLEVTAVADSGLSRDLLPRIVATPGVRVAVPTVRAQLGVGDARVLVLGVDASILSIDSDLKQTLQRQLAAGGLPIDGVLAGPGMNAVKGAPLALGPERATVALVIDDPAAARLNGGRFVVTTIAQAQRIAERPDRLDSILVLADPDTDVDALRTDLVAATGGQALVAEPGFRAEQTASATGLTRDATLMVAAIALVVAAFLVFNSMNMAVAQRKPTVAMLRALGGRRSALVRDLLVEAALIGLVGATLGVPAGMAAGWFIIGMLPPFLVQAIDARIEYLLPWYAIPATLLACVVACLAASALAARTVFGVSPVEALVPAEVVTQEDARRSSRLLAPVLSIGAIAASVVLASTVEDRWALAAAGLGTAGALGICYVLIGPINRASGAIAQRFGAPGRLAATAIHRAPRRVWATAITVAIAVATGIATQGALRDMVDSSSDTLASLADADMYVSGTSKDMIPTSPILPSGLSEAVRAVPGVASVIPVQYAYVTVGSARVLMEGAPAESATPAFRLMSPQLRERVGRGEGVVISRQLTKTTGLRVGAVLELPSPTGVRRAPILGTVDYLTMDAGLIAIGLPAMQQWLARDGATYLEIDFMPQADPAATQTAVRAVLPETVLAYSGADALHGARGAIEQSGILAIGIQWVIALVTAIALLNTLMLSVLARRREIGVLRAIGASRRFITRAVLAEAGAVGIVGGAIGLVFGASLHYLGTMILSATTSIRVTYTVHPLALVYAAVALGLCLLGAIPPARRAGRIGIVEAVSAD